MNIKDKNRWVKKFVAAILAALMCTGAFTGCALQNSAQQTGALYSQDLVNFKANVFDIETGESQDVRFTVESKSGNSLSAVNLYNDETVLGEMKDDGQNGDYIANDGIYTCTVTLYQPNRCAVDYYAGYDGMKSNTFTIAFYTLFTEEEYEGFLETSETVDECSDYNSAYQLISSSDEITGFEADENSQTITYITESGITGIWDVPVKEDTKGDRRNPDEISIPAEDEKYGNILNDVDSLNVSAIGSKKSVLVLRPFRNDGFEYDDFLYAGATLAKASNGTVDVYDDSQADLDMFKSFEDYGIVLVDSHGALNYEQSYIVTGERLDSSNFQSCSADLTAGRIVIGGGKCYINSKFFDKYYATNSLDDTTVFLGSCYSAYNDSFGNALINKGSPLVLGYSDAVYVWYCNDTLKSFLIDNMLFGGQEASSAFSNTVTECGESDGAAEFVMFKNGNDVRLFDLNTESVGGAITSFSVPENMDIVLGEAGVIEPDIIADDGTEYTIRWTSSDPDVVNVNSEGNVGVLNTLSSGTSTITASVVTDRDVYTDETVVHVAPIARDVVLVLDCSGSMMGEPFDEMKEVAQQFCDDILNDHSNNRIAVVSYETYVNSTGLTSDISSIKDYISDLYTTGSTNMEGALSEAGNILADQGNPEAIQNIIIMTDGLPNVGKTSSSNSFVTSSGYSGDIYANAVLDTANSLMSNYNVYSLGFFHSLYGTSFEYATDLVSQLTNVEDGYYEVNQAENLQFAFGDIGETINDGSKIIVNIACPVDVIISYGDEYLSSASSDYQDTASFGSLELLGQDKDIKTVTLDSDKVYDIQLSGTGDGTMDMSVGYYNGDNELYDSREFAKVPLSNTVKMDTSTDNDGVMALNIDANGDGNYDDVWEAGENAKGSSSVQKVPEMSVTRSSENAIETWQICLIVFCCVFLVAAIIVSIVFGVKSSTKKAKLVEMNIADHPVYKGEQQHYQIGETEDLSVQTAKHLMPSIQVKPITRKFVLNNGMNGAKINYELSQGQTLNIGKDTAWANVILPKDYSKASRKHCTLCLDESGNRFVINDLSLNGLTRSDGSKLKKGINYILPGETIYLPEKRMYIKFLNSQEK